MLMTFQFLTTFNLWSQIKLGLSTRLNENFRPRFSLIFQHKEKMLIFISISDIQNKLIILKTTEGLEIPTKKKICVIIQSLIILFKENETTGNYKKIIHNLSVQIIAVSLKRSWYGSLWGWRRHIALSFCSESLKIQFFAVFKQSKCIHENLTCCLWER